MDERISLGLIYTYNEAWIGGTYYIEHIVNALNLLPDIRKPKLCIYGNSEAKYLELKEKTNYPYLSFRSTLLDESFISKVKRKIFNLTSIRLFKETRPDGKEIDFIFPNPFGYFFDRIPESKKIAWIPDFQELHIPEYFKEEELKSRFDFAKGISLKEGKVVFSSRDAEKDFIDQFPKSKSKRIIMPFAITKEHKERTKTELEAVKKKYGIGDFFFLIPNQLWIHKNHSTVLEAVSLLKEKGEQISFICTGKEEDYRFPEYPESLKRKAVENNVKDEFRFLGFIPKSDLEVLITACNAIIQPSLFEGWNTSIEEAKAQGKYIIASDIRIHLEQMESYPNAQFFSKKNTHELADTLVAFINERPESVSYNYNEDLGRFATDITQLWH